MSRSWRLEITECGRPLLANAVHRMNRFAATKARQEWKDAAWGHAKEQRIPALSALSLTVQARYKTRRTPGDCDGPAPAVKGVLDGLVLAGVIPDDGIPFVKSVLYVQPQIGTGLPDALVVWVEEAV